MFACVYFIEYIHEAFCLTRAELDFLQLSRVVPVCLLIVHNQHEQVVQRVFIIGPEMRRFTNGDRVDLHVAHIKIGVVPFEQIL